MRVPRASEPVRAVLIAAALVAGYLLFSQLVTVVLIVVLALVLALPLMAAANACERHGIPRAIGALLALIAIVAAVGGVLYLIIPTLVDEATRLANAVPGIVTDIQRQIGHATGRSQGSVAHSLQKAINGVIKDPQQLAGPVATIGLGVAGVLGTLVVVVMAAFYIAANPEPLRDGLLALFPSSRQADVLRVLDEIRSAWWGWLQGVAVDMLVSGTLLYAGLRIIGLDYAIVFATLCAILVVIPYLGSIASGIPPVAFALSISPEKALLTLGVYVLVQQMEGNVIVPLVMARTTSLHPAVILGGVVVVGELLGFLGLLVGVPIIAATVILVRAIWVDPMHQAEQPADPKATSSTTPVASASTSTPARGKDPGRLRTRSGTA